MPRNIEFKELKFKYCELENTGNELFNKIKDLNIDKISFIF